MTLAFASTLRLQFGIDGPWQLAVALVNTKDALLGNLGEGWAEPGSFENRVGGCEEPNILWVVELDHLPDSDGQRELAYKVGARVEDAWGVKQRRYLDHRGDLVGKLDIRRAVR